MEGIIYKYTSPSNKVYIGQTINEKARRNCFLNINHCYAGGKIDLARAKYLPECFSYTVLERIYDNDKYKLLQRLNELEIKYIEQFDSFRSGYNSTPGGQTLYIYSDEDKNKISKSKIKKVVQYDLEGYFISIWDSAKEAGEALHIDRTGIAKCCRKVATHAGCYIWRYFEENFPIIIDGLPDKKIKSIIISSQSINSTNGRTFKKIIQYDLQGNKLKVWNSMQEAVENIKVLQNSITNCCQGRYKSAGGFIWRYFTEDAPDKINEITSKHSLIIANKDKFVIYQYTLDKTLVRCYKSYKEAEYINSDWHRAGIYQCCTKQLKTYKGYIWSYVQLS